MYLVQEAARISGVSVRTLHYYDQIDLLKPEKQENHYRYYTDDDLNQLQLILFYKYLGFPLKEIRSMLHQSSKSRLTILTEQLTLMKHKQAKLLTLVQTLEETIRELKGEITMTQEQKFSGFNYEDNAPYREEAVATYGAEQIEAAEARQKGHEQELADKMNAVFFALAGANQEGVPVDADRSQEQVATLFDLMNRYVFDCSLEVFGQIGRGYVADERFKRNIDQFGEGTAQYACDAIQVYVQRQLDQQA